jgi:hypothetical protein
MNVKLKFPANILTAKNGTFVADCQQTNPAISLPMKFWHTFISNFDNFFDFGKKTPTTISSQQNLLQQNSL